MIDANIRPMQTAISSLRRKLGDDANNPTYILNEPRVGYRMEKGEALPDNALGDSPRRFPSEATVEDPEGSYVPPS